MSDETPAANDNSYSIESMRSYAARPAARSICVRKHMLNKLAAAIAEHEEALLNALNSDLGKPAIEAYASEVGFVLHDIQYTVKHLASWARPIRHHTPFGLRPGKSIVYAEPRGVVLIIGPWNYPFQLVMSPLVAALAAGNCAVLKPSELAPHTSAVIAELISSTFSRDYVRVETGDYRVAEALQRQPFDHIFFTGGTEIGRKVMAAAAQNLTPVTLELGGKCPVILCEDANLDVAARRIVRGKFMNAGQTCVAPDHVWVPAARHQELIDHLKEAITTFYGSDPLQNPDYGRIVNRQHTERLTNYLDGQAISFGGRFDIGSCYMEPTLVSNPALNSPLMQEEIFGPILPVLSYTQLDQALSELRRRPSPLALYIFGENKQTIDHILIALPSGGACVNDTVSHLLVAGMPFGGTGASGMGAYHGRTGFDTFTQYRSILRRRIHPDFKQAYPPYTLSLTAFKKLLHIFLH